MFIKNLFKIGLVAVFAASVVTLEAKPRKGKEKPDKPRPEKKIDREKVKERLKAAHDKREKRRDEMKKKFSGKDIQSPELNEIREKMRELHKELLELRKEHQKEMKKRMMEIKKEFANKRDKIIDNNKPGE